VKSAIFFTDGEQITAEATTLNFQTATMHVFGGSWVFVVVFVQLAAVICAETV
jgi:hypothetical protein